MFGIALRIRVFEVRHRFLGKQAFQVLEVFFKPSNTISNKFLWLKHKEREKENSVQFLYRVISNSQETLLHPSVG